MTNTTCNSGITWIYHTISSLFWLYIKQPTQSTSFANFYVHMFLRKKRNMVAQVRVLTCSKQEKRKKGTVVSCNYYLLQKKKKATFTISEVAEEKKSVHIFLILCKSILARADYKTKRLEGSYLQEFIAIQYPSLSKAGRTWKRQRIWEALEF